MDNIKLNSIILLLVFAISVVLFTPILNSSAVTKEEGLTNFQLVDVKSKLRLNFESESSSTCAAYFKNKLDESHCRSGEVPAQVAFWIFIFALLGFVCLLNKRKI